MIYPPSQKPPIWSIDPGVIAYNCQKAGMPHPVLAMPMWEGAGDRVMDYSGHGNHGSLINNPVWDKDVIGLEYASSQYISCGNDQSIALNDTDFTIVATINLTNYVSEAELVNPIVNMGAGGGDGKRFGMHLEFVGATTTRYHCELDDNSTKIELDITNRYATPGKLETIAFVRNYQSTIGCYVEGVEVGSNVDATGDLGNFNGLPLLIGGYEYTLGGGVTKFFDGLIYQVLIFNASLMANQIKLISDNPYFMYQIPEELYGYVAGAPPVGAIMNQFQHLNLGSDLFNGALI